MCGKALDSAALSHSAPPATVYASQDLAAHLTLVYVHLHIYTEWLNTAIWVPPSSQRGGCWNVLVLTRWQGTRGRGRAGAA